MLTRTELDAKAKELQEKYAYKDGERVLSGNSEIFHADIARTYAIFLEAIKGNEANNDIVIPAKRPVETAVGHYNDEQRMVRLEQLEGMSGKDAMRSYLENQCVKGFELKKDKDSGNWIVAGTDAVELKAFDFVSTICSADLNGILDACCIFVDNVAKNEFGEDAAISRKSLHESYIEMRKRKDWTLPKDKKATNKFLAAQLTEICNMISFKTAPVMQNADVKFIKFFVISARSKANEEGRFVVRNDSTIVEAIFRAMWTRQNGKPYKWQNQNGADKNPAKSSAPNKDMAENSKTGEFGPAVEAEAGPVTLGTPEK